MMKTLLIILVFIFAISIQGQNKEMALAGDPIEQFKYAQMIYTSSNGDDKEAYEWFLKAAEQGNADAQRQLGTMYSRGDYVERDKKKSFYWSNLAANNGDPMAAYWVANSYYFGIGVEKNEDKAISMWIFAIENQPDYAMKRIWFLALDESVISKYDKNATPDIMKTDLNNAKNTAALSIAFALGYGSY